MRQRFTIVTIMACGATVSGQIISKTKLKSKSM
jgi:hypothetical protein